MIRVWAFQIRIVPWGRVAAFALACLTASR